MTVRAVLLRPGVDFCGFPDGTAGQPDRGGWEVGACCELVRSLPGDAEKDGDLRQTHQVVHAVSVLLALDGVKG